MTLQDWLAWATALDNIYQKVLNRSAFSDHEAFVNWTYHWREGGKSAEWIEDKIRKSPEAQSQLQESNVESPRLIKITEAWMGDFVPRMYSYWANTYVPHENGSMAFTFVGDASGKPRLFKTELELTPVVTEYRIPDLPSYGTTEGWFWDSFGRVNYPLNLQLLAAHPSDREIINPQFDVPIFSPKTHRVFQVHKAGTNHAFSATIQEIKENGPYENVGTVRIRNGDIAHFSTKPGYTLDESQISTDGNWLLIKELDPNGRLTNRVVGPNFQERLIPYEAGPLGHCDVGTDFAIGEDATHGVCVRLNFRDLSRVMFYNTWNLGHVSIQGDKCLISNETDLLMLDAQSGQEIFRIKHNAERVEEGYDFQVKANLSPCGRIATFTMWQNGRHDVWLLLTE